jgi:hypothetical protein
MALEDGQELDQPVSVLDTPPFIAWEDWYPFEVVGILKGMN